MIRTFKKTAMLLTVTVVASAQWDPYPWKRVPRTAEGKVDLNAPAQRTPYGKPDLSGFWLPENPTKHLLNLAADLEDVPLKPWARAAIDVARQFSANDRFIEALVPGPGVITTPDLSPALDVSMLDTGRSWVLIATNTSSAPVAATVRLPDGAPYAIWLDVLDGSTLAMNGAAAGPRWDLRLDARSAHVYMIEKVKK